MGLVLFGSIAAFGFIIGLGIQQVRIQRLCNKKKKFENDLKSSVWKNIEISKDLLNQESLK